MIKKKPKVIELIDSDDEDDQMRQFDCDEERKKKHGELTKRLHKRRRTPCKFKIYYLYTNSYCGPIYLILILAFKKEK